MSARSRFLKHRDLLVKPKVRFEKWLTSEGYEACSSNYPAAVHATALVNEYVQEYPDHSEDKAIIESHAEAIGWISNYDPNEEDEYDSDE
jgi:hypothetical protein